MKTIAESSYFEWLVDRTGDIGLGYRRLLEIAHEIDFFSCVPNDDNRAAEGLYLRDEYRADTGFYVDLDRGCTLLEMMIALSARMNDVAWDRDDPYKENYWFWVMIANLNLMDYFDESWDPLSDGVVRNLLKRVVNRTYRSNGKGGLFPLVNPGDRDQREVEVWYQMQSWLGENQPQI
jgi:hypothetical protein